MIHPGRPKFITSDHLEFLDDLKETGINMFGSQPLIIAKFGLIRPVAREILLYWMKTLGKEVR